ncbi:holo-ACP synthase [Streptomyces auratus]|uniref:Holo-[acyl-carrier-protein] synthase n=1 Tax=Streptomyces auratus AGR0001 TaxID=1160718 RepID=J2K6W3_9ACTN|nr:holo-ACP synthase [Streptomyces auratus]QTZ94650.1 holo-ACP synthase [Streptomyces auratus AGR0001]
MSGRVGIDLVPFGRVREMAERENGLALTRMLSEEEMRISHTAGSPDIAGIAGRLAAKEAVFKLFRARGQTLPWLGIEILKDDGGWPVVRLGGRAAELASSAGFQRIEVSITHDEPCAVAVAFCAGAPGADAGRLTSA